MNKALGSRFAVLAAMTAVILGLSFASVALFACAYENYPSVHFNTAQPDFGAPPRPLSIESWGEAHYRPYGDTPRENINWNQQYYLENLREKRGSEALAHARRLEGDGRFEQAMDHYRHALKLGVGETAAVRDREEVRREMTRSASRKLLNLYLDARTDYELNHWKRAEASMKTLAANRRAGFLRAHALYVLGAIQYDRGKFRDAAAIFESLARLYPKSPRRESALIMVARSLLRSPVQKDVYVWVDKPLPLGSSVTCSRRALVTLLRDCPGTRFREDALGWLARCDYVQGSRVAALESYLRLYGSFKNKSAMAIQAASIYFVSQKLTSADARRLRSDLRRDSGLLAPYLDYRIYHGHAQKRELAQLADLASQAARRQRLRLPARIAARLAEIQYLRGRYREAILWSKRSLASSSGDGKDLAIYVRGACFRRTGRMSAAESDFLRVLRSYPKSYLSGAARENLALLYERRERLDLALDQYFRLRYQEDIAYILDARMSTRQVAAYLSRHPRHPQRDLLVYTLGIRQLRDNRLSEAAKTLSRLPDRTVKMMMSPAKGSYWWDSGHTRARDPRTTARDLARLETAVRKARGADARAQSLYAQASYIYNRRDLLFYNAALWQGERSIAFGEYWDEKAATRRDQTAVREHHHDHECLFRARELCLRIVKQYPKSPTAPKALYRAACATNYQAHFNYWWRNEADRLSLENQSVSLMMRVYQKYPKDPLAMPARKYAGVFRGTEAAATRTGMFEVAKK